MWRSFKRFLIEDRAVAAIEAGLLFPVMVSMLCGTVDMGMAVVTNLKVTNACQMVGDLLTRGDNVTDAEIQDAIVAGELAMLPYSTASFGVDIAGVQFIGEELDPTVQWRETVNMLPNDSILENSAGLGDEDEGVVAVTTSFVYTPYFSSFIISDITMGEEAYVRGRKGLFIQKEE